MFRVVIADNAFAPIGPEREILSPQDFDVVFLSSTDEEEVIKHTRDADAIICDAAPITERVLANAPRVRVVSEYGIGYDNIDVAAASARGVWVANVPGFCVSEVADHTLAFLLALSRRIVPLNDGLCRGAWGPRSAGSITRLADQTLGLVGFGPIARAVAARALPFGLRVACWTPHTTAERVASFGAELVDLEELFRRSDYLSLHVPATAETRGMVSRERLALMKQTAYIINCGRGSLIDEPALVDALRDGQIAGAALDVFATEPLPPTDPLLSRPNVIVTPHAAFYSEESLRDLQIRAAKNVAAVLAGGRPLSPVNNPRRLS
ncbi:MAG TPA: C-terminal binding protein [Chloroflexota bacterium]|nr:C-terminal binding protein [Chloroflexota bacterium]